MKEVSVQEVLDQGPQGQPASPESRGSQDRGGRPPEQGHNDRHVKQVRHDGMDVRQALQPVLAKHTYTLVPVRHVMVAGTVRRGRLCRGRHSSKSAPSGPGGKRDGAVKAPESRVKVAR